MSVTEPTPPPARSRYAMGSLPNMARSLLVIAALMALVIFMVPRVNSLSGPPVDIPATAQRVAAESGWPVAIAAGLPSGWKATSARYVRTGEGAMTWLAGYQAPSGDYASVEQTRDASSTWVETEVNRASEQGTVEVGGRTWTKYVRSSKTQNSLLHRPGAPGELTTLVTGTASFEELAVLIEHLEPVSP
ncbi:MAG: DUF4245 domain-containing protein [Dermatophilaceae bacterium]